MTRLQRTALGLAAEVLTIAATALVVLLILYFSVTLPLAAQIVVETTVLPVTASELIEISIIDDQLGGLRAVIMYDVLTDTGDEWKTRQVLRFTLDVSDTAQLNGFIFATVLPAVNAAEGL